MSQSHDIDSFETPSMTRRELVLWWESRRLGYNALIGVVGLATMVAVLVAGSAAVKPGVDFEEPLGFIVLPILYGIMANVCYTSGWLFDIARRNRQPSKRLFRAGLWFSIALTMLPGLWAVAAWLWTIYTGKKLD